MYSTVLWQKDKAESILLSNWIVLIPIIGTCSFGKKMQMCQQSVDIYLNLVTWLVGYFYSALYRIMARVKKRLWPYWARLLPIAWMEAINKRKNISLYHMQCIYIHIWNINCEGPFYQNLKSFLASCLEFIRAHDSSALSTLNLQLLINCCTGLTIKPQNSETKTDQGNGETTPLKCQGGLLPRKTFLSRRTFAKEDSFFLSFALLPERFKFARSCNVRMVV